MTITERKAKLIIERIKAARVRALIRAARKGQA